MIWKRELSFAIIPTNVLTMVHVSILQPKLSFRHSVLSHECYISLLHFTSFKDSVDADRVLSHEIMDNVNDEII